MADLKNAFSCSASIWETRKVLTARNSATNIVTHEEWTKDDQMDAMTGLLLTCAMQPASCAPIYGSRTASSLSLLQPPVRHGFTKAASGLRRLRRSKPRHRNRECDIGVCGKYTGEKNSDH